MGNPGTIPRVTDAAGKHMQCMEVWGGNHHIDTSVVLPGLDAWVYSQPHGGGLASTGGGKVEGVGGRDGVGNREGGGNRDGGGGDVHYVSSCASGMIARILVADVAGHGTSVAEIADR